MKIIFNKFILIGSFCLLFLSLFLSHKIESAGPANFFVSSTPSSIMPDSTVQIDLQVDVAGICTPSVTINNSVAEPSFTGFACGDAPTDWTLDSATGTQCQYSSSVLPMLSSGTHFTFQVHSPDSDNASYDFEINAGCAFTSHNLTIGIDNTILAIQPISENTAATSEEFSFDTNADAVCRYSSDTSVYADMTNMSITGSTSHSHTITGLADSTGYTYYIRCQDSVGNTTPVSELNFTTTDGTAPIISSLINSLITKTSALFSFATNENAECKYAATDTDYDNMANLESTGSLEHYQNLSGLVAGTDYTYYIKCSDANNNISSSGTSFQTERNATRHGSYLMSRPYLSASNFPGTNSSIGRTENYISKIKDVKINLFLSSSGPDVRTLQEFLVAEGKGIQAEKLKQHGLTNYFGPLTKAALIEWQKAMNIKPASGYFGSITREKLRSF